MHPPEALRAFPLLSRGCAVREGGRRQRGGAALARRPLASAVLVLPWQTNILFTDLHAEVAPAFTTWLAQHGVRVTSSLYGGATRLRWVTHLDVSEADVTAALDCVASFRLPG